MITVVVNRGISGNLISATASGHAGMGKRGSDIVCAAATILLRTTLTVLSESGMSVDATTSGPGTLAFCVTAFAEKDIPFLRYAADFLLEGLGSLQKEYPKSLEMRVSLIS